MSRRRTLATAVLDDSELRIEHGDAPDRFVLVRADAKGNEVATLAFARSELQELYDVLELAWIALRSIEQGSRIQPARYEMDEEGNVRGVYTDQPAFPAGNGRGTR